MKKFLLVAILAIFSTMQLSAVVPSNEKIPLEKDWLFLKGDIANIWEAVTTVKATVPIWEPVTLPHCFNSEDAVDPEVNYYEGPGWYKTLLSIDNPNPEGRIMLDFEGAGQKTDVYVYMTKVGSHVGGYDEWSVDITDAVEEFLKSDVAKSKKFNGRVPLTIRCDNTRDAEMIPSDLSDFNIYGGIYRKLNLVYVPAVSFENVYAKAEVDVKGKLGELSIYNTLYNPEDYKGDVEITVEVFNPLGEKIVTEVVKPSTFDKEECLYSTTIKKPMLWDTSNPQLYTCKLTLKTEVGEVEAQERFGFRHVEFVENGPFMLNGKRVLLRGTHRHEDHAGLAAALTDDIMRDEMKMMDEMGVNFIRLGHYQQSELILDLCDEYGIVVWEEIPWCRGGVGGELYQDQAHRMLTNMIRQHRNHPAVVVWGMGNENDWPGDFPTFENDSIRAHMQSLHNLSHKLDPTRSTCIRRCDFARDIIDVYSFSVWPGWYSGRYTDYYNAMYFAYKNTKRFLHVEWGGDSHAGRFSENPYKNIDEPDYNVQRTGQTTGKKFNSTNTISAANKGDWSESYICDLFDWCLKEQENMPWLTGAANWTFKDFSTPLRPENPVPYVNQKGLITRDGTPKESYYVFQSYWAEKPMIRLFGHKWYVRWGEKGEAKQVRVYSNCDRVELFMNGESQGIKVRNSQDYPAAGLRWDCVMNEGENTFKAVGYKGKGKNEVVVVDEMTQGYQSAKWGKPAKIAAEIIERGDDYVIVEALLKDAKDVLCLDANNRVSFDYSGDGEMIYNQGTPWGSRIVEVANGRAQIKISKKSNQKGALSIKVDGLPSELLIVE